MSSNLTNKKVPFLPNVEALVQAGLDPQTLSLQKSRKESPTLVGIRTRLRVQDEQDAIKRFKWTGLPKGINQQLLERIIYYKGQAILFHMESNDTYYFLPYALQGDLDVYGRYTGVTPIPFCGSSVISDDTKVKPWIPGMIKTPVYDTDTEVKNMEDCCVILKDYTEQMGQNIIPRQKLQEVVINMESEAFPMARTSLMANSGIKGMRVQDEDSKANVKLASRSITDASINGDPWIPIVGAIEFQDLTSSGSAQKCEEYLEYMQALDNFRKDCYAPSGGLYQKKAHMLESEQEMNSSSSSSSLDDSLDRRKEFCEIANKVFGLSISVELADNIQATGEAPAGDDKGDTFVNNEEVKETEENE